VGRSKEEWMRQQELEPMYEWIEENFGDDAGEEGSDEWAIAVQAFEDYCEEQQRLEAEDYYQSEMEWYLYTKSPIGTFNAQMRNIEELLSMEASSDAHYSLLVMLYGHVVASLEAYMASTFIQQVTDSDELIRKLVESDPTFSKMKFSMKEIYEKHENLKLTVAKYLKDLIFHDIKKVKPMFKKVLNCDFGDISWLFRAVEMRHHCVHRAGLDKDGNRIDISAESIRNVVLKSSQLVTKIEDTMFLIENPDGLLF
tara:strand:- start:642 stop:1406 length:765 start_codon:yes stop_codon:yes gene_type:complete